MNRIVGGTLGGVEAYRISLIGVIQGRATTCIGSQPVLVSKMANELNPLDKPKRTEKTPSETTQKPKGAVLAVRCHDIIVSLGKKVTEFDQLIILGMAVRLALHLRGVEAVPYDLLRQICLHLLRIPPTVLGRVLELLAEVEFVKVYQEGKTIKSIIPTVPYYEDLFQGIGEYGGTCQMSEPESLTLTMLERLAKSPTPKSTIINLGAEPKLVNQMIRVGSEGGYITQRRARGKDILLSPVFFYENPDKFADLAAGSGSGNVEVVLTALSRNQGWPLALTKQSSKIGDTALTPQQLEIVLSLAGEGFAAPPAIETSHSGSNFFLFGPKPGMARLTPTKRSVFESAMALVAAVRQGQLLPARYAIRSPEAILRALRDRKFVGSNSEAMEQYKELVFLRLGRLVKTLNGQARFELIDTEENLEAVDMAIELVSGGEKLPSVSEEIVLAFKKGQTYLEPLLARTVLQEQEAVSLDPEDREEIDNLLLKGLP